MNLDYIYIYIVDFFVFVSVLWVSFLCFSVCLSYTLSSLSAFWISFYIDFFFGLSQICMFSMDNLCFLCSFIIHWNVGTYVLSLLIYNKRICLAESPCHYISVFMNICVVTRHFFMIIWKCLKVDWVYISEMGPVYLIKSYMFYLLMFPCFTNRSCQHFMKSLGSFPPFCVIELDPMTGKSLQ